MEYDVFVCHASEDKGFVEPLALALKDKGLHVWYDRFQLSLGDSLRQEIDRGLANSRYGIVVLSKAFFQKRWPQSELDALASRQNAEGRKVILPIWHGIEADLVRKHSPLLESLLAARSCDGLESVVSQVLSVCSEPVVGQNRSVFPPTGDIGLRERCLDVIRREDQSEWVKLVDELQAPIEEQLVAWKKDGETAIQQDGNAWKQAVLKATDICVPGFLPLFASVE
ncbi:MAG: toll/interleukin-1 receptor domain-containing protein, partial [Planctomycetota bacterium]|nr:toll/interleukin-1 receptor domain-containing protein [Planctomycetota bacterium]